MTVAGLEYLKQCMMDMIIPYELLEWTAPLRFPYWVGEYTEIEPLSEDGMEQSTLILTGTSNKSLYELELTKEKVKAFFPATGRTAILHNNSGIAVCYSSGFPVLTGEQGLYRMQINLTVKEWRVQSE